MGTNFYVRGFGRSDEPGNHLGKRSAAGAYCWDCRVTLCMDGEERIHYGTSEWYKMCPKCGAVPGVVNESAMKELGFKKDSLTKLGVGSCCSFSWAVAPALWEQMVTEEKPCCESCNRPFEDVDKVIEDEYGTTYTVEEFKKVLEDCPVQSTASVGKWFS